MHENAISHRSSARRFQKPALGPHRYVIADLVGKNYQTLMSKLSRQYGHKLGADLVCPLMRKISSLRALDFLAREMNGVPVPSYCSCRTYLK